ncbi:Inner centromere protein-related protein pic1 [Sphaceloma murrayae]|uniref:Inner centromere protein-related protein pic1 n=1 Tax=Sphaceloma murrayae TaxID=2082308 RepID=A0A2K1QHF8_9PEZI|nr:Inner centromere protein-related protein pic1 [Sphaceloma murrayae]
MSKTRGVCSPRFGEIRELLEKFIATGEELGASIVVNIDGKDEVDLWGGYVDTERQREWQQDTITNVMSSSKTVVGLVGVILAERGLIDFDAPVARYWPEFGANGKENILIRHILSHTSGVPGWDEPMTLEDICNWEKATEALARQPPWWEPGTASGYHAFTFGFLLGEVVRRVTGKSYRDFVRDELSRPLNADFQLGVQQQDIGRVSDMVPPPATGPASPPPGSMLEKVFTSPPFTPTWANTPEWRAADLGGANGHTNAKGIAKLLSVISLGGEVEGRRYVSQPILDRIFEEQSFGTDLVTQDSFRFGIGFHIRGDGARLDWLPAGKICYWGGMGGSMAVMDVDRRMTITYMMNKMDNVGLCSERAKAYIQAVYKVCT